MTSDGFPETLNHIQYNPTTYAKGKCRGKYAYVFFFHMGCNMFFLQSALSLAIT